MSKAKVGLIVDDRAQSKQVHDLLKMSHNSEVYEITHLVVQKVSGSNIISLRRKPMDFIKRRGIKKLVATITFKIICKLEEYIVKKNPILKDFFDKYNLDEFDIPKIEVSPIISKSGFVYRYSEDDLNQIKNRKFDILVRSGSGILRGDILSACKKGIISFHHANNDLNRGSPPGFWEVVKRQKSTGFVIQILKDELDGGDVIFKGSIPTSFLYTLNRVKLYKKANIFMHKILENIFTNNKPIRVYPKRPYDQPLLTTPDLTKQVEYIFRTGIYVSQKIMRRLLGKESRWSVAYQYCENWRDISLWKSKIIENPSNRFLADPFVIKYANKYYCFVEDYSYLSKRALISVYEINNDGAKELGVALEEDFHLSYPFLIEDDGQLYMCPETHQNKDIRIYKCIEFPLKWKLEKVLISNISAVDTSIFKRNGRWWLLTNIDTSNIGDHDSELHLYSSDTLLSENWIPHPLNPIIFDSERASNGGLLHENNEIFRVYQKQGWNTYGEGFGVARIVSINDHEYIEETEFEISSDFFKNAKGTHTYSFNNGLIAIDFVSITKTGN